MENTWWEKISNPSRFISDITTAAIGGSSVVIELPSYTPWVDECREEIIETLQNKTDRAVETVEDNGDPGEIIYNNYCNEDKKLEYRPAIGHARFLAESDDIVLNELFIWVDCSLPDRAAAWNSFVAEYLKIRGNKSGGIFVIVCTSATLVQPRKGIKSFIYGDYANEFDTYVFTMLKSSETRLRPHEKQYLATLVSELTGNNAELASMISSNEYYHRFLKDPESVFGEIIGSRFMSSGECFSMPYAGDELKKRIWKAQINTIFPLIEEYRSRFVRKYYEKVKSLLPLDNPGDDDEPYNEPEEVEIGVLWFVAANRRIELSFDEFAELSRVRNARNNLAHIHILDYSEVEWLLNTLPDNR